MVERKRRLRSAVWVAVVTLWAGACAPEDVLGKLTDARPGFDGTSPDARVECPKERIRWRATVVYQSVDGTSHDPIAGVEGCVVGEEQCGFTDDQGVWEPCLPPSSDVALTFVKAGYARTLIPFRTSDELPASEPNSVFRLNDDDVTGAFWRQIGVEYPPTEQALVTITMLENDVEQWDELTCLAGASADAVSQADVGPEYWDVGGNHNPDRTRTDLGVCHVAFAFESGAEEAIIRLSHPEFHACSQLDEAWAGPEPNTIRVPLKVGFRTRMFATCH